LPQLTQAAALRMLQDMHQLAAQQNSSNAKKPNKAGDAESMADFWEPYYATLPAYGSLKTLYNFPISYLPLLQDTYLVSHVSTFSGDLLGQFLRDLQLAVQTHAVCTLP
jgi:hypothetical protein